MSVQLFCCAPVKFFRNCEGIDPERTADDFLNTIEAATGLRLPANSWRDGMMEDVWPSELVRMHERLKELNLREVSRDLGGDLCLPTTISVKKKISFPWSWYTGAPAEIYTISTGDFATAIEALEPVIKASFEDCDAILQHFDLYRRAIRYSNKRKFPIFWSV